MKLNDEPIGFDNDDQLESAMLNDAEVLAGINFFHSRVRNGICFDLCL